MSWTQNLVPLARAQARKTSRSLSLRTFPKYHRTIRKVRRMQKRH